MKRNVAYMGLFLALALICSYIETLIPINFGIPGVKLGLTNIVIVIMLYCVGAREAILVSIMRVLLAGFMFGNAFSIIYSLAGGILSFIIMFLIMKLPKLHCVTISTIGGIFHNIGQIVVAAIVVENINIFYYIPVLIVSGAVTGLLIGVLSQEMIIRIGTRIMKQREDS